MADPLTTPAVAVTPKPWWDSKTMYLGFLLFLSSLGAITTGVKLSPTALGIVGMIVAGATCVTRIITGAPIAGSPAASVAPLVKEIIKARTPKKAKAAAPKPDSTLP